MHHTKCFPPPRPCFTHLMVCFLEVLEVLLCRLERSSGAFRLCPVVVVFREAEQSITEAGLLTQVLQAGLEAVSGQMGKVLKYQETGVQSQRIRGVPRGSSHRKP